MIQVTVDWTFLLVTTIVPSVAILLPLVWLVVHVRRIEMNIDALHIDVLTGEKLP